MGPRTHAPKPPCLVHVRGCPEAMYSQPAHGVSPTPQLEELTSEEAEKKNSPQGAQHCWAHTREPQPQRHTRPNAHCSTAGNIQDKRAAQMPVYGRMGKRCPHAYSGIALSQKRDKTGPSVETRMDPETDTQ